jgi:hypothetical protein
MQTLHSTETRQQATAATFTPLAQEQRTHVDTNAAAHYLNRKPQTLRGWHCHGAYPDGLRPTAINGRLIWPVSGIKKLLGV